MFFVYHLTIPLCILNRLLLLSQSYEEVFADTCRTARGDRTNYWVVYKPKGSDRPNPSPTPRPQQEPTPTSSSSCIYDLNLRDNGFLQDGQRLRSPDDSDLYLEQRDNGLLAIRDNGRTIWDSGAYGREGDYWTQLQVSRVITLIE